jgi:putative NADH-flavin reductase
MTRIHVLGGTGYAGAHIVAEAQRRGHDVTSYSRHKPAEPIAGVEYRTGSVLDPAFLAESVTDADVVFDSLSPRGDLVGRLEDVVDQLIGLLRGTGVRFGVLGGASSLQVSEGGPLLFDVNPMPAEVLPEVRTGMTVLDTLRAAPEDLDWFFVSPAAEFGAWAPGERTGAYRTSDDVLLVDENGKSFISGADLAVAVVDEIETAKHRRRRFHVAH